MEQLVQDSGASNASPVPRPAGSSPERRYGADDVPPTGLTLLTALQHLAVIAPIGLVFPALVVSRAGADQTTADAVIATSMLVLGLATLLQCLRWRGIGSGYFAPAIFTAAYLPPSLDAAEQGGLPLVFGMTLFAGACEVVISRALHRLRPYLPAEIAGLAVTMIGVMLGLLGFRLLWALPAGGAGSLGVSALSPVTAVGLLALAATVGVSIWGPQRARIYAVLIALVAAWLVAAAAGQIDLARLRATLAEGVVAWPRWQWRTPAFEPRLAIEFGVGALACSLRAVGDLTTCQKINDPRWLRPDLASLKRGVFADGLGTVLAGLLGTVGVNTFSGSIGLSAATGIKARRVGVAIGCIFIALAFIPGVVALVGSIPPPVTGAVLLFAASFVLLNGLQVMLSRLLDNRKILVIGLGLIVGLSREAFPAFFHGLPASVAAWTGSPLVLGLLMAILLNLVFRIGVGRRARLDLQPGAAAIDQVHAFCDAQGGAWAARRDVMQRVTTALVEFAENSSELVAAGRTASIELAFDEFRIDATIRYIGESMEPAAGGSDPRAGEPPEVDELPANLPFLIIARMADRAESGQQGAAHWLRLSFEH